MLLSHRAWTRRFGADPDVVGTVVDVRNEPHTVVGVLAEGFYFPDPRVEAWTPYVLRADEPTAIVLGRLRGRRLGRAGRRRGRRHPAGHGRGRRPPPGWRDRGLAPENAPDIAARVTRVIPLQEEMVGEYRPALRALTGATLLVLLIACVNVAGLLLARGVTRRRELAVRAALGAGRGRIVRQLLTESVLLSLGGGALALATAAAVLRAVPALVPGTVTRLDEVGLDGVVAAFTLGLSVVVGLVFGAAPAFRWSGRRLLHTLVEGSARSSGGFGLLRANRTRAGLAAAQVALALVLLVGAGLLLRSFVGLVTLDRGYEPTNVIAAGTRDATVRIGMPFREYVATVRRFYGELAESMDRLSLLPDVAAAGVSSAIPLAGSGPVQQRVRIDGRPAPADTGELPSALLRVASPGYFDVMRMRLVDGRLFTSRDDAGSPPVLVVNETFARVVLRGAPPLGQRVRFAGAGAGALDAGGADVPWEVVGVVADVTYRGLAVTGSGGGSVRAGAASRRRAGIRLRLSVRRGADHRRSARGGPVPSRGGGRGAPGRRRRQRDDHGRASVGSGRPAPLLRRPRRVLRGRSRSCWRPSASTACSATPSRTGGGRLPSAWPWAPGAATCSRWSSGRAPPSSPPAPSSASPPRRHRAASWRASSTASPPTTG